MLPDINQDQYRKLLSDPGVKLVDVWASWCGPCRQLTPILEQLATEETGIKFYKLNADDNRALCAELKIRGLPTMLLIKNGQVVEALTGAYPRDKIKDFLAKHK